MRTPTVTCHVHDNFLGRVIDRQTLPVGTVNGLTASERLRIWVEIQYPDLFWTIQKDEVHNPEMETSE